MTQADRDKETGSDKDKAYYSERTTEIDYDSIKGPKEIRDIWSKLPESTRDSDLEPDRFERGRMPSGKRFDGIADRNYRDLVRHLDQKLSADFKLILSEWTSALGYKFSSRVDQIISNVEVDTSYAIQSSTKDLKRLVTTFIQDLITKDSVEPFDIDGKNITVRRPASLG